MVYGRCSLLFCGLHVSNVQLYYLFIYAFFCSELFVLYYKFAIFFKITTQAWGLASHKTRFNPPLFLLKMSFTKSDIWKLLSNSMMAFVFVGLQCFCCFPLIVDVFPSGLVCIPDLFYQSIYDFWTVVFYCCHY